MTRFRSVVPTPTRGEYLQAQRNTVTPPPPQRGTRQHGNLDVKEDWALRAACRGKGWPHTDIWINPHLHDRRAVTEAVKLCATCPVFNECLLDDIGVGIKAGIAHMPSSVSTRQCVMCNTVFEGATNAEDVFAAVPAATGPGTQAGPRLSACGAGVGVVPGGHAVAGDRGEGRGVGYDGAAVAARGPDRRSGRCRYRAPVAGPESGAVVEHECGLCQAGACRTW